jgi:hypothetical protein
MHDLSAPKVTKSHDTGQVDDLRHNQHRLIRKILAHTVAVFLNLQVG